MLVCSTLLPCSLCQVGRASPKRITKDDNVNSVESQRLYKDRISNLNVCIDIDFSTYSDDRCPLSTGFDIGTK